MTSTRKIVLTVEIDSEPLMENAVLSAFAVKVLTALTADMSTEVFGEAGVKVTEVTTIAKRTRKEPSK